MSVAFPLSEASCVKIRVYLLRGYIRKRCDDSKRVLFAKIESSLASAEISEAGDGVRII